MGSCFWKKKEEGEFNTMPLAKELLLPLAKDEQRKHKLKRLVQHPNSYFMDVKCLVVIASPRFSPTPRPSWSARDAQLCSANPLGEGPGSLKAAPSEGRARSNFRGQASFKERNM